MLRKTPAIKGAAPGVPGRLLLVDDEGDIRHSLSRRLETRGYRVETAQCGEEALEKVRRERYDLVLLDHMMPGLSGLDLLKLLRATHSASELPVILVTAADEDSVMAEALEEGANDYILKPVEMVDVTARIQTQLRRSQARLTRGPTSSDSRWEWDPESNEARYSDGWAQLVGCRVSELGATLDAWLNRIHPADLARVRRELNLHLESGSQEFCSEHRLRCNSGSYRWMVMRGQASRAEDGRLLRVSGTLADLAKHHGADPLTGLETRSSLIGRMSDAFAGARPDQTFAILLLDLDDFRMLNEQAGHEIADHVLLETSVRLRNLLASGPYLGRSELTRMGSDEFAILVRCGSGPCEIASLAEAVLACFREPVADPAGSGGLPARDSLTISASVGVAISSGENLPDRLLRDADLALRHAQRQGRRNWALFEPALRNQARMRATLVRDLRYAIERNQLIVAYQPKVSLRNHAVVGFEALMRWRHPQFGIVSPQDFIPIAEESSEILAAGEWIMRTACRQLAEWRKVNPGLEMSVNLSARQISDPCLPPMVQNILSETGVPASSLALELTESSLIEEEEVARAILTAMRRVGVRLMLDDFGTGYASLSYLNALPFDALKIDRSFVSSMDSDPQRAAIVRTILGLVRELRMCAVAEGIETEAQLGMLREMGCEFGQGYYFSNPVNAARAEGFLEIGFASKPESIAV